MRTTCGTILAGVVAVATCVATAAPTVTAVNMSQPAKGGRVTITYTLSEQPAVITLDVQTNYTENAVEKWSSIGGEHIWNAEGDVWKKVTTTSGTITWHPDQSWKNPNGNGFVVDGTTHKARAVVTAWPLNNTPDYMVVDISSSATQNSQRYYPAVDFLPGSELGQSGAITNNVAYKETKLVMRKIMAKNVIWTMGSIMETGRNTTTENTHEVMLTNNYYIGVFEFTQAQWKSATPNNRLKGNYFTSENAWRPVEKIAHAEIRNTYGGYTPSAATLWPNNPSAGSLLGKLRSKTGLDFDLPSEAEWEFAARAGNGEKHWGDGSTMSGSSPDGNLDKLTRYTGTVTVASADTVATTPPSDGGTAIVGSYAPNAWGIYDMHGNVKEWCQDYWSDDIGSYGGAVNVKFDEPGKTLAGSTSNTRVVRGGAWNSGATTCRAARREGVYILVSDPPNYIGFRVVCRAGLD